MSIRAVYENGVFKPLESVPLKEGREVEVYPRAEEGEMAGSAGSPFASVAPMACGPIATASAKELITLTAFGGCRTGDHAFSVFEALLVLEWLPVR